MTIRPAAAGRGIVFHRTDLGEDAVILAVASNVTGTERGTTLSCREASVSTIEHLMSAAAGLGIDNMLVETDSPEVPILDGSALPYVQAILADGLQELPAARKRLQLRRPFHWEDPSSGAFIDILPAGEQTIDLTVDFDSRVLGLQRFRYDSSVDYASQIAPCRTFCFFHELEYLAERGLIKGGDTDNAIVVVERPVERAAIERMKGIFGVEDLRVCEGYLNNIRLHFPDEIVRHKMLDLIGDFALLGAPLQGTIIAAKTGHRINTAVCKSLLESDLLY